MHEGWLDLDGWKQLLLLVLILAVAFGTGFLSGSLNQASIYKSKVEPIADINPCYL